MQNYKKHHLQGISGWLLLVAIGVVIQPWQSLFSIYNTYSDFFSEGYWALLTDSSSQYHVNGLAASFMLLAGIISVRIVAGLFAIYLFFCKKALFPAFYILVMVSAAVVQLGEVWFAVHFLKTGLEPQLLIHLSVSVISMMIWSLYLLRSQRVKNTFIQPCQWRRFAFGVCSCSVILCSGLGGYFHRINDEEAAQATLLKHTLSEIAGEINRVAPDMIDDDIRFDSVQANNLTLVYHYSLVEYEKKYMDVNKFSSVMTPRIIREDCLNKNILALLEQGAVFSHTYVDLNGEPLTRVNVDRRRCREAKLPGIPM